MSAIRVVLVDDHPVVHSGIRTLIENTGDIEGGWFSRRVTARMVTWTRRHEAPAYELTERELEVLRLLAKGWANAAIAAELGISERTVRFHLRNLYDKLDVHTRGEAMALALGESLV